MNIDYRKCSKIINPLLIQNKRIMVKMSKAGGKCTAYGLSKDDGIILTDIRSKVMPLFTLPEDSIY